MHKFFVDGKRVSKDKAKEHWFNSKTYENASKRTRDSIWKIATKGDKFGNHNPAGEVEHLEEAGITLE